MFCCVWVLYNRLQQPLSHHASATVTPFCLPCRRRLRTSCSMFKMLQHVWSLRPGNMSMVCLGWCTMTCTGWLFLSEFTQYKLAVTVHRSSALNSSQHLRCARCHQLSVPRVRRSTSGTRAFLSPDQESGIHFPIICKIQLLTPNNLGEILRRICSLDVRSVSALEVSRNRALQIDIDLVTYIVTV